MRRSCWRLLLCGLVILSDLGLSATLADAQTFDWQVHKGTALRVLGNKNPQGLSLETLLPEFEKLTGIKVQFETFNEDQFREKLMLEMAGGTGGIDAFMTSTAQEGLRFFRAGWYEPLDGYLKNPRLTDAGFDLADIGNAVQGNVYDGKLVCLPISQVTTMMYYRKDIFAKHHIAVPQTFQALEEAAKSLNQVEDGGQKITAITLRGKGAAATSQWAPYMFSMGGNWLTKDGKPAINSPEAIRAFEFYGRLLRLYGPPGAVNYNMLDTNALFSQGKAAILIEGSSRVFYYEDPAKSKVVGKTGYALFPAGPASRTPTTEIWSIAVSSQSKKKEAAYLFAEWAASKDVALKLQLQGAPVPRASVWKDPRFLAKHETHKDWIETSLKSREIASPAWNPPVMAVSEVRDVVGQVIVSSILGQDVKAAADKAAAEMSKILEKTEGK